MRAALFCHSIISDWNHGNAHFLRGVATEMLSLGHDVKVFEPRDAWSVQNLLACEGRKAVERFGKAYRGLTSRRYDLDKLDIAEALDGADLVLVHEWNDPELVRRVGEHRRRRGGFHLLFHDTHHRSATDPAAMARYDLSAYDGVLAFGAVIRDIYLSEGWTRRAWTWHEAADMRVFHPTEGASLAGDLVWVGNWGDGERTCEIEEFILEPSRRLGLKSVIYGVRYPEEARQALCRAGVRYGGWLANFDVPKVFARHRATVHVPRRPYVKALPGIPTIRVFEALACGVPLVSAPWEDVEGLFHPGRDFLTARDGDEMAELLAELLSNPRLARCTAASGLETILTRHTCAHRVEELMDICRRLDAEASGKARVAPPAPRLRAAGKGGAPRAGRRA